MRTLLAVVVTVFLLIANDLHAADRPASASDLAKLQDQVSVVDKDVAVLKEVAASRLDAQDKRLSDIGLTTAQQANQLAAISNQTTTVGNYIAMTSVLITILVSAAGFVTYFSAKNRAEQEAREASKTWFEERSAALQAEIEKLKKQAETAVAQIDGHTQTVAKATAHAIEKAKVSEELFDQAAKKILSQTTPSADASSAVDAEAKFTIEKADVELTRKPEADFTHEDHFTRGVAQYTKGNYPSALESFNLALAVEKANALTTVKYLFAKGVTLTNLNRAEEAIAMYDQIDQRFGKVEAPAVREQVAKALVNKGVTLGTLNRSEEEIAVYDQIDQRFGKDEAPAVREQVAMALVNKGFRLGTLNRSEEEIAVYDQIDQRFGQDEAPAVREQAARALFNKGVRLGTLNRFEEEIAVYDQIDQRFGQDEAPAVREQVAMALFNKGVRLGTLNRFEEEIAVYDQIDQRFGKDEAPAVREQVAMALFNKGVRLGTLNRSEEEIAVYDQIDQRFGKDEAPAVREQVARALLNQGVRLGTLNRSEEEIAVYDQIDQRFGKDEAPAVRERVAKALVNKGVTLGTLNRSEEEIAVYDQIDQRFGKDEAPAVREQVAGALNGAGFGRIMLAKTQWADGQARTLLLTRAQADLVRSLEYGAKDDRAMILGNLGYALFLSGQCAQARQPTLECLKLGGQTLLDGQRGDAQQHRVEPEDSNYEAMLDELWLVVNPQEPGDDPVAPA